MLLDQLEILLLSLIQGVSEFLPVSSTAHLVIVSKLYQFENQNLLIDISLHLGSLLAILFFFRDKFFNFKKNKKLFANILIATLPLLPVGYFLYETGLIQYLRNIKVIAWTTLFFGILIYFADKSKNSKKISSGLNIKISLIVGLFQVLALIPGVSRAGITITASRFLGFDRIDSSKIAFYLSIPALTAVSIFGIYNLSQQNIEFNILAFTGIIFSFLFSLATINFFLKFVSKFTLNIFVLYRIILSMILFLIIYL